MRIRKRGNAQGESSGARPGGGSHHKELVSSRAVQEKTTADEAVLDVMRKTGEELRGTGLSVGGGNERAGSSTSRPSPTLVVDLWQSGKETFTPSEPYMNLDDFVRSLARENGFPAEALTAHGASITARESSLMSILKSDGLQFERLAGERLTNFPAARSMHAELDTSLRLGQATSHPATAPSSNQDRGKRKVDYADFSKESESDFENDSRRNLAPEFHVKRRDNQRTEYGTTEDAASEGQNKKNFPPSSPIEARDVSDTAQRTLPDLEAAQLDFESSPSDQQARKSSTESMEPRFNRKRRVSSATGRPKRRRLSPPAPTTEELLPVLAADHPAKQPRRSLMFSLYTIFHEVGRAGLTAGEAMSIIMQQGLPGFEDSKCRSRRHVTKLLRSSLYFMELGEGKFALCSAMINEEDEPSQEAAGSGSSPQQAESSKRPRASTLSVSSPTLTTANEQRKQEVELERSTRKVNESTGPTTAGASSQPTETARKPSGRSGRPKKLKYLKQDNVEELGNQCNRTDGKGWMCPLLAKAGYQLCDHHLDKLRCKPGSRSKYNKKKKKHN